MRFLKRDPMKPDLGPTGILLDKDKLPVDTSLLKQSEGAREQLYWQRLLQSGVEPALQAGSDSPWRYVAPAAPGHVTTGTRNVDLAPEYADDVARYEAMTGRPGPYPTYVGPSFGAIDLQYPPSFGGHVDWPERKGHVDLPEQNWVIPDGPYFILPNPVPNWAEGEPRDAYAMAARQAPRLPVTPARAPADNQQTADAPSRSWLSPFIAPGIQPPIFVQRDT